MRETFIWVRTSVNWEDEHAFLAQCEPAFLPKVEAWNATFTMPYHRFRARVHAIARRNLAEVRGVTCTARWDDIPDGAVVLPVDDDDWFAPGVAEVLAERWDGSSRLISWRETFLDVPIRLHHRPGRIARRLVPALPPVFVCSTNNYALVKQPGFEVLAERHVRAHQWSVEHHPPALRGLRLSVMNRTLGSQTTLGLHRQTLSRAFLVRRHAAYRRLYARTTGAPAWCGPPLAAMAALMAEVQVR